MSGHWICEYCRSEWMHSPECRCCRPEKDQWMGNRTREEMKKLTKREKQEIEKRR
jgi:hypothetical protein